MIWWLRHNDAHDNFADDNNQCNKNNDDDDNNDTSTGIDASTSKRESWLGSFATKMVCCIQVWDVSFIIERNIDHQ